MATTYTDQFWIIDPFNPPSRGTVLNVQDFDAIDVNDDGYLDTTSGDTINGFDITATYVGDTIRVRFPVGGVQKISGATFYLSDGRQFFTPLDGTILEDATFIGSSYVTSQNRVPISKLAPPCFTAGTLISTPQGDRRVETLRAGDKVLDCDGAPIVLRAVMSQALTATALRANPRLRPVRICAGALGGGLPRRDLLVSRQHRMLVSSPIARRMFGADDVLVSAMRLTDLLGIHVDETVETVTYFHLLFDRHEVILAENAPSESLFLGREALKSVSPDARDEIYALFPDVKNPLFEPVPARLIPSGSKQRKLVERHVRNARPLLQQDRVRA